MSARAALLAAMLCAALAMVTVGCTGEASTAPSSSSGGYGGGGVFSISSPAFEANGLMPKRHATVAAGGENVSPPYEWRNVPAGTESFAMVVIDEHPIANGWVHWAVAGLPADARGLPAAASRTSMPTSALELRNSFGSAGWGGPQPPVGTGRHEYRATIFALDTADLEISPESSATQLLAAIKGHVLGQASVAGSYSR